MTTIGDDSNVVSGTVFALWHPDNTITVDVDGHAFTSEQSARESLKLAKNDTHGHECDECGLAPDRHFVMYRNVYRWRTV